MAEGTRWLDVSEPLKIVDENGNKQDNINPVTKKQYSSTLNRNENKNKDSEPDYRGPVHLYFSEEMLAIISRNNGKLKCNLSGWDRDGTNGKFMSLQLQHPVDAPEPVAAGEQSEF